MFCVRDSVAEVGIAPIAAVAFEVAAPDIVGEGAESGGAVVGEEDELWVGSGVDEGAEAEGAFGEG